MAVFEFILILLSAILLSNFINRFMPKVTTPVIQILLGVCISFLPLKINLEMETELFFVLFVAPLIFQTSMQADNKIFWQFRGTILNMAFVLVILSVVGIGYAVHLLIPAIPLAVAFTLIAALGPTDDVAVASVAKRVRIPNKLMAVISGESIINDASGIVSFQIALAVVLSGSFSITQAAGNLVFVAIGGILTGLCFTLATYLLIKWMRKLGVENITFYLLVEILMPFLVYMLAESWHVSGILAVFTTGIAHTLGWSRLNPDRAGQYTASNNIWNMLTFTLEGVVYLILGCQLPNILKNINSGTYPINLWEIVLYIAIITLIFTVSRYIWAYFTLPRKVYDGETSKTRTCMIFSLAGARGAVTMASIISVPVFLSDGSAFPQRDLIILLATGVIICSLFITNFILPLVVGQNTQTDKEAQETAAYLEILNKVIKKLGDRVTETNRMAAWTVIRQYKSRIQTLQNKPYIEYDRKLKQQWEEQALKWELECVTTLLENGQADETVATHYLNILNKRMRKKHLFQGISERFFFAMKIRGKSRKKDHNTQLHQHFINLKKQCDLYVIEKLKAVTGNDDNLVIKSLLMNYEFSSQIMQHMQEPSAGYASEEDSMESLVMEIASYGFQLERDGIQTMYEEGRLSWETARELRNNITLLETQME